MCGRIVLKAPASQVAAQFELLDAPDLDARYNIAPTRPVLAVRRDPAGVRRGDLLQWGLIPPWSPDPRAGAKMFNARSETVTDKPAFAEAFAERRCLIPVDGFYEWHHRGGQKQPHYFFAADERLLALAGLWAYWEFPGGKVLESCSILTCAANLFMRRFHHRMPVVLSDTDCETWLATPADHATDLLAMLVPAGESVLRQWPVSADVGNVANDSADLIVPVHDDPPAQLNLF